MRYTVEGPSEHGTWAVLQAPEGSAPVHLCECRSQDDAEHIKHALEHFEVIEEWARGFSLKK